MYILGNHFGERPDMELKRLLKVGAPDGPRLLIDELLNGERVRGYNNVFHMWTDLGEPLTREEIMAYAGPLDDLPFGKYPKDGMYKADYSPAEIRLDHIKRVRRAMLNIEGCPPVLMHQFKFYDTYCLVDGHHRLLAAYMLGNTSIAIQWRGIWEVLCSKFPASAEAGLLNSRSNEVRWHVGAAKDWARRQAMTPEHRRAEYIRRVCA